MENMKMNINAKKRSMVLQVYKKVLFLFQIAAPTFSMANNSEKPNIIIIVADDLGSGDVSCLFRDVVKTPNIDRLAEAGVIFSSGYVPVPLCGPSRAALFTGQYPQRYGFGVNNGGIPTDLPLLPRVLQKAGYYTGLIGKWHSRGPMPHERGCFDETLCSANSSPFIDYYQPRLARNGQIKTYDEYSTDLFAREAEEFIDRNQDKPFALTVAFNAPHIRKVVKNATLIRQAYDQSVEEGKPAVVPIASMARPGDVEKFVPDFPEDSSRAEVVAAIFALDQAVGRILDKLKDNGLDKKTMIFFFSDNGGHPENRSENLPLRDYKWSLYEGGIRVPFFAVYPGVFPVGRVYDYPVSTLDIFPTCMALSGACAPDNLDGINLMPYLTQKKIKKPPHEILYFSYPKLGAVRYGKWKLVLVEDESPKFFDLTIDTEEKNNIAPSNAALVTELTEKWKKWHAQMPPN